MEIYKKNPDIENPFTIYKQVSDKLSYKITSKGFTYLHYLVMKYHEMGSIDYLVTYFDKHKKEAQEYINKQNDEGWTPLILSVHNCITISDIAVVKILLENGADVGINIQTNIGITALMMCTMLSARAIKDGIYLDNKTEIELVKMLLDNGANNGINIKSNDGLTALMYYVDNRIETNINTVKLLLDYGADTGINLRNNSGMTALMLSLQYHNTDSNISIIKLLLEYGAKTDIELHNTNYEVLAMCVRNSLGDPDSNLQTIRLLLEHDCSNLNFMEAKIKYCFQLLCHKELMIPHHTGILNLLDICKKYSKIRYRSEIIRTLERYKITEKELDQVISYDDSILIELDQPIQYNVSDIKNIPSFCEKILSYTSCFCLGDNTLKEYLYSRNLSWIYEMYRYGECGNITDPYIFNNLPLRWCTVNRQLDLLYSITSARQNTNVN